MFGSAGTQFLAGLFGLLEDSCIFALEIYEFFSYEKDIIIGGSIIIAFFLCQCPILRQGIRATGNS